MNIDRLTLVLIYSQQHRNITADPVNARYVEWCRQRALLSQ